MAGRAGVSPTAPYRHYADRDALVSAVAAQGCRERAGYLAAAHPSPTTPDGLAAVAVAYVRFALERPALFRVMFAEPCDPNSEERVSATTAISEYVRGVLGGAFPGADPDTLSTTVWALVHGLAFLHLDGKPSTSHRWPSATMSRRATGSFGRPRGPSGHTRTVSPAASGSSARPGPETPGVSGES